MIIPLDKLNSFKKNKFEFSKAAMMAVTRLKNIKGYPEPDLNWKIVPNILKMMLDEDIQYQRSKEIEKESNG
ncbi:MAG: hypothetical protein ACOC2H_01555 [Spirochaetota bacterium]